MTYDSGKGSRQILVALWLLLTWGSLVSVLVARPALAADPLRGCWKVQLKAASKYAKKIGGCLEKAAQGQDVAACSVTPASKLANKWRKAQNKAASKSANCSEGPSSADVAISIGDLFTVAQSTVQSAVAEGSPDPARAQLTGALAKATGKFAGKLLAAEAKNAKEPNAGTLRAARRKARAKFRTGWDKAVGQAASEGVGFSTSSSAVADVVEAELAALAVDVKVGTPAPVPDPCGETSVEAKLAGIAVQASGPARVGYFLNQNCLTSQCLSILVLLGDGTSAILLTLEGYIPSDGKRGFTPSCDATLWYETEVHPGLPEDRNIWVDVCPTVRVTKTIDGLISGSFSGRVGLVQGEGAPTVTVTDGRFSCVQRAG
jgi:hypothetical protein